MAIAIALGLTLLIILCVSETPGEAVKYFIAGPLMKFTRLANVVEMMLPLVFTGIAVCLVSRTGIINLGAEGAFTLGGSVAAIIAVRWALPAGVHPAAALLLGGAVGALCMLVPVAVRLKFDASEVVASLMLNYIAWYFGCFLVRTFVRNPAAGQLQSLPFRDTAVLARVIPTTRIHAGLFVAAAFVAAFWIYLFKSRWGFRMRMVGSNLTFARYAGIEVGKSVMIAQALAGFACGVGGACEMLGMYTAFKWTGAPGYGWDGILVATLAGFNPLLVPLSAFFLAYMRVGADIMTRMTDVQNEVVSVIQGVVIILLAARSFLSGWEKKAVFKQATAGAAAKEGVES